MTPDEKEIWISDGHNQRVHYFDATAMPPKQLGSIPLRDDPGWVTFSIDGRYAYPSSGEVIDVATHKSSPRWKTRNIAMWPARSCWKSISLTASPSATEISLAWDR